MIKYLKKGNKVSICIFPGTFNPIHEGHLKMAKFALDNFNFEKIIFIPAYLPPHKEINKNLAQHRYNMVKLAIASNSKFEISDIEYQSEGKSYSLITVQKIIEQYNIKDRLNFIIGTDAFAKIDTWYKAEELKELVHFIVFKRRGEEIGNISPNWDYEIANMDYADISSTEVRNGKNTQNQEVEDYINHHGLYKI